MRNALSLHFDNHLPEYAILIGIRQSLGNGRAAIATIFFVNGFGFASWVPHIPTVKSRLAIGADVLGLALLAVAAGGVITMPVTGALIARWGSRRVTLASSVAFAIAAALPVRAPGLGTLVAALFALGVANGAMDVAMNAHGVALERKLARPILSSLHALFSLGGLAGAGASIIALAAGLSPEGHSAIAAALSLVLVALAWRGLDAELVDAGTGPSFVLPRGPLLLLGAMGFLVLLTEGAIADWSAVYLRSVDAAPALVGAGYAALSCAMAAGRLGGDAVVARLGPVAVLRAGGLLAALGLAAAIAIPAPAVAIVGFGLAGLGLSNLVPVLFGAAGRTPGISTGTAIASVATAGYGGFMLGPPLIGAVAERAGLPLALALPAAFMAVVAACARWARN